jgi:hypothetical protein
MSQSDKLRPVVLDEATIEVESRRSKVNWAVEPKNGGRDSRSDGCTAGMVKRLV